MRRESLKKQAKSDPSMIEVYYSGRALEDHAMSVRDLAPALLGFADAIDRYKEIAFPLLDLDVRIKATEEGSFDVWLQLAGVAVSVVQSLDPSSASQLAAGIIEIIRILNERFRATGRITPGDHEVVKQTETHVETDFNGKRFSFDRKAYNASRDGKMIKALGEASMPSRLDGFDPVRFSHPASGSESYVNRSVSDAMGDLVVSEQPIAPSIETTTLQIDGIQSRSSKWRFRKGDETFWCEIADEDFLGDWLNRRVAFMCGDLMKVKLETEQYVQDGVLMNGRRRIVHVDKLISLGHQPELPVDMG